MITECFSKSHGLNCTGSVRVRCIDLGSASAFKDLEQVLLDHVLECRTCLAVALLSSDTLSQSGCPTYRKLFDSLGLPLEQIRRQRHPAQ